MQLAGIVILAVSAIVQPEQQAAQSHIHRVPQIRESVSTFFAMPDRRPAANEPKLFTCPLDGAQLSVPAGKGDSTPTCPVDGAEMKASKPTKKFLMLERP